VLGARCVRQLVLLGRDLLALTLLLVRLGRWLRLPDLVGRRIVGRRSLAGLSLEHVLAPLLVGLRRQPQARPVEPFAHRSSASKRRS
jgi:hypothetical protein